MQRYSSAASTSHDAVAWTVMLLCVALSSSASAFVGQQVLVNGSVVESIGRNLLSIDGDEVDNVIHSSLQNLMLLLGEHTEDLQKKQKQIVDELTRSRTLHGRQASDTGFKKLPAVTKLRVQDGVPLDFQYREYLAMYPDLHSLKITTEEAATLHFIEYGHKEGRLPRLPPMVVQYTVCGSLVEQLYAHLSAWVISSGVGAAAVLPPAVCSEGYRKYKPVPLETLFNVDQLIKSGQLQLALMYELPETEYKSVTASGKVLYNFPDFSKVKEDDAYAMWNPHQIEGAAHLSFNVLYNATKGAEDLILHMLKMVGEKGVDLFQHKLRKLDEERTLLIQLPCLFYALDAAKAVKKSSSTVNSMDAAAKLLFFNRDLEAVVAALIKKLKSRESTSKYNAIVVMNSHDWDAWTTNKFPMEYVKYEHAMSTFKPKLPCYVAFEEEFFSMYNEDRFVQLRHNLVEHAEVCVSLVSRHTITDEKTEKLLQGLTTEQRSLIELLVLRSAEQVVVSYESLMGLFLSNYKAVKYGATKSVVRVQTRIVATKKKEEIDSLLRGGRFSRDLLSSGEGVASLYVDKKSELKRYKVAM